MSDYNHAATYRSGEQLARWEDRSEGMGFRSHSEFVEAMVEAGLKKFDETNRELREQRNELKAELDRLKRFVPRELNEKGNSPIVPFCLYTSTVSSTSTTSAESVSI